MQLSSLHSSPRRFFLLLFCLILLGGCANQVSTAEIRRDVVSGNYDSLGKALKESYKDRPVMMNALNLGRYYQFQGRWDESIKYFDAALVTLEEYEQRAIISLRNITGNIGTYTFSRGSASNFGTGYERSLLHTFNGLNYLMQGDFQGAAVEMRRMELRQELWLEEVQHRIKAQVDEANKERKKVDSAWSEAGDEYNANRLPAGYSMSDILASPELRNMASSYQDAFSYSLSAIICRIYGDAEYAKVSLSRAIQLDERAYQMFSAAWQRDKANKKSRDKRWEPAVPPLPPLYQEGSSKNPDNQELVLIVFGGLAPAMKVEQVRIPYPYVGYLMFDLTSYEPAIQAREPQIHLSAGNISAYPLLRTDLLAYRHLKDEIGYEMASSMSRAITRAAVSVGGQAIAASHEDTQAFAPLIGFLLTLGMDVFASSGNDNVRNWELLPVRGWLGLSDVPRGTSIALTFAGSEYKVSIPREARGMVVLVSQVENAKLKVDYVTY